MFYGRLICGIVKSKLQYMKFHFRIDSPMSSIGGFEPHSTSSPRGRTARTELFRSGKGYTFATVQCICAYEFSSKILSCIVLHIRKQRFIWKCAMFIYSLCVLTVDPWIRLSTTYSISQSVG